MSQAGSIPSLQCDTGDTGEVGPLGSRHETQLIWAFIALGIVARSVRYLLRFPLWDDECFLMSNLLERGFCDMARPLDYGQVCPIGFLWLELAFAKLLGFSEYTLRLPAFVCGLCSLFLFRHLAGRLLKGTALVVAVAIFAVAYPCIRYSAEAKPYGCDMLLAMVFFTLAVRWWQSAQQSRWLWGMVVLVPPAMFLSYPTVFVAGGLSIVVAHAIWSSPGRRGWLPWIVLNLVLLASFAAAYLLVVRPQAVAELNAMTLFWHGNFPPVGEPLALLLWLVDAHTGPMLAYPFGGPNAGSTLTFICCATGVVVLCRRREFTFLLICLCPLALTFLAAALGRYPYGGMVRFQFYMAPMFIVLAGLGLAALLTRLGSRRRNSPRPVLIALGVLGLIGAASVGRDFAFPAKTAVDMRQRDFARWFWFDMPHDGELVCLKTDLKLDFSPETYRHGFSAMYLCNQKIYSPRHARGEPPRWDRVSADWPLRCVQFRSSIYEFDEAAFEAWIERMKARYDLVSQDRYPFACYDKRATKLRTIVYVELHKFIPKGAVPGEPLATAEIARMKRH